MSQKSFLFLTAVGYTETMMPHFSQQTGNVQNKGKAVWLYKKALSASKAADPQISS